MPDGGKGDDFRDMARDMAERKRDQDQRDLGHEQAGLETGRQRRFLTSGNINEQSGKKEGRGRGLSALELLLLDPAYAAAYEAFGERLRDAEQRIETALAEMRGELQEIDTAIDEALEGGTRLPDGRVVFQYADGRVIDSEGNAVDPADVEGIQWKPGATSAEDYMALRERREALAAMIAEAERYQVEVLGNLRDRYEDQDNPITLEEMEQFEVDIDDVLSRRLQPELEAIEAIPEQRAHSALGVQSPTVKN